MGVQELQGFKVFVGLQEDVDQEVPLGQWENQENLEMMERMESLVFKDYQALLVPQEILGTRVLGVIRVLKVQLVFLAQQVPEEIQGKMEPQEEWEFQDLLEALEKEVYKEVQVPEAFKAYQVQVVRMEWLERTGRLVCKDHQE